MVGDREQSRTAGRAVQALVCGTAHPDRATAYPEAACERAVDECELRDCVAVFVEGLHQKGLRGAGREMGLLLSSLLKEGGL